MDKKWIPEIGMNVEVTDMDHCGGGFVNGQVGKIIQIGEYDFQVEANGDYWWYCRECVRPLDTKKNGMKIYIAGPYSNGDVEENVRIAIHAGDYVARFGHIPFIPHLTHFWHMLIHHDYEFWMKQDMEWLKECDALLRLEGESKGADREVAMAQELGLKIYTSVFDVPRE